MPFIALSAETVSKLQNVRVGTGMILVIENQTVFEAVLRSPLVDERILYLYSGGHAGHAERGLLAKWLAADQDIRWHIWTDWDEGGIAIQRDWAKWAQGRMLSQPIPLMWDESWLSHWPALGRPIDGALAARLAARADPLSVCLLNAGYTLEQEAVLPDLAHLGKPMLDVVCPIAASWSANSDRYSPRVALRSISPASDS